MPTDLFTNPRRRRGIGQLAVLGLGLCLLPLSLGRAADADERHDQNAASQNQPPHVLLPAQIEPDPIVEHLRAGRFQDALNLADRALQEPHALARYLYLRGMAQLALAEADEDFSPAGFKDAGLSFVRVIVYFPHSRYTGPALVELGYVHARIGRDDLARSLYDRARGRIDQENDPDYHQRLIEMIDALP